MHQVRPIEDGARVNRVGGLVTCILAVCVLAPLAVAPPALGDYPNHLVRLMLLAAPPADAAYVADWGIKPDLVMDGLVWLAAKVMPVAVAMRLFAGLTLAVTAAGALAVARVLHGRLGLVQGLVGLVLYNIAFLYGLLAFLFGLGCSLLAFAAWMAAAAWPAWRRLALAALLCLGLFFCHLFALGIFGLLAGAWELGRWRGWRTTATNLVLLALAAVPAFALLTVVPAGPADTPAATWETFGYRVYLMFKAAFLGGLPSDDIAMGAVVAAWVVLAIGHRRLPVTRAARLPLAIVAAGALACPSVGFGGMMVDSRLPLLTALLAIAAIPPEMFPRRHAALVLAPFLAIALWRAVELSHMWQADASRTAEFRAAESVVAPGARVVVAMTPTAKAILPQMEHVADYLAVDRGAFVTTLNAQRDQQPLWVAPRYAALDVGRKAFMVYVKDLAAATTAEGQAAILRDPPPPWGLFHQPPWFFGWPEKFDYLVIIGGDDGPQLSAGLVEEVARGSFFRICRVISGAR